MTSEFQAQAGRIWEADATVLDNQTILVFEWAHCLEFFIDLSPTKTVSNRVSNFGDNVFFPITAFNSGPDAATGVAVDHDLPAGLSFVSDPSGGAYLPGTGIWTIGNLAYGASVTLNITISVDATGTMTNVVPWPSIRTVILSLRQGLIPWVSTASSTM